MLKSVRSTITRTIWTTPQRVASVWVGTDDSGASDAYPDGSNSVQFVQAAANTDGGQTATPANNVTVHNTLIAYAACSGTPSTTSISDSQGNAWTLVISHTARRS